MKYILELFSNIAYKLIIGMFRRRGIIKALKDIIIKPYLQDIKGDIEQELYRRRFMNNINIFDLEKDINNILNRKLKDDYLDKYVKNIVNILKQDT